MGSKDYEKLKRLPMGQPLFLKENFFMPVPNQLSQILYSHSPMSFVIVRRRLHAPWVVG
jgi:hypothetical protein